MDKRNQNLPAWMSGYQDTGLTAESTDNVTYGIWQQDFRAGTEITLGTNGMTGTVTNYTVLVKEQAFIIDPPDPTILGDVNCDNVIDARDLTLLKRHLLQQSALMDTAYANADADGNGAVNAADVSELIDRLFGTYKVYFVVKY